MPRRPRRQYTKLLSEATALGVNLSGIRKNDVEELRRRVEAARRRKDHNGR